MERKICILLAAAAAATLAAHSAEIGFLEEFALSSDREATLAKLVPGSDEYYRYAILVAQQKGDFDEAERLLAQFKERHGTKEYEDMSLRESLLAVDPSSQQSLRDFTRSDPFRSRAHLNHGHFKKAGVPPDQYPATLAGALDFDGWFAAAFQGGRYLDRIPDTGLDALDPSMLDAEQRRQYLRRLFFRPAIPDFWKIVADDLRAKDSEGFGAYRVHSKLLLADLEALAKEMPELLSNARFASETARRLLPGNPAWTLDLAQKRATLARLRAFAETLPPSQNSFKAHVFYHALAADRAAGVFDRALFDAYLRLPRNTRYIRPQWRDSLAAAGQWQPADLGSPFEDWTSLPPVVDDEPLVRDLLSRQMLEADDWRPFAEFFPDDYARKLFAETKLLAGIDDPASLDALRPLNEYDRLLNRVDIDLLPDNPAIYAPDEPVVLSVAVKNVSRLSVQVFEIDTFHYFRDNAEVTTAIDLDGLSPTFERTVAFDQPPLRRHEEKIAIPEIAGRGIFVVELIGDTGVSSRAVIRRGRLFAAIRKSSAGAMATVFNESLEPVPDARAWIAGREFAADDSGEILIPYVAADGTSPLSRASRLLLRDGDFTDTLDFHPDAESYDFGADFLLDREELVPGESAAVLVVPRLACAGVPVSPSLVESPVLEISVADSAGAGSIRRFPLDPLPDTGAIRREFVVPEGVSRVALRLSGRVGNIALGRDEDVSAERVLDVDPVPSASAAITFDAYLRRTSEGLSVELLGKNGEPVAGRVLNFRFGHRDFNIDQDRPILAQTGADGRVTIGPLPPDVTWLTVDFDGRRATWRLATRDVDLPDTLSVAAGERVELPDPAPAGMRVFAPASLYRRNSAGVEVSDASAALSVSGGVVAIEGLEPGDYALSLPTLAGRRAIALRVHGKPLGNGFAAGESALAELDAPAMPRVDAFDFASDTGKVRIHVANATPSTRVHLLARWSVSDPLPGFAARRFPGAEGALWPASSLYVSGRVLGDEARYVMERRFAAAHPGNMLAKPSLLLRPWETRSTGSTRIDAQEGGAYDRMVADAAAMAAMRGEAFGSGAGMPVAEPARSFGFLPAPALFAENLAPDANGDIAVDRSVFGFRSEVVVMLDDLLARSVESFALPPAALAPRERALAATLPMDRDVAERKSVARLAAGESLSFADARSARFECIDTVGRLYSLLRAFARDDGQASRHLADFAFVGKWADMPRAEKIAAYSKYACHELDLFIYFKDRPFFDEVVAPFIAHAHAPDFIDDWLLGRDLSRWTVPAGQSPHNPRAELNFAELALLARRSEPAERARLARYIADCAELRRISWEELDRRFLSVLGADGPSREPPAPEAAAAAEDAAGLARNAGRAMDAAPAAAAPMRGARRKAAAPVALGALAAEDFEAADSDLMMSDARFLGEDGAKGGAALAMRKSARMESDKRRRGSGQAFFRSPERTKEWVESRYYRASRERQDSGLVPAADFWRDAALAENGTPFVSAALFRLGADNGFASFTEAMLAIALTDLPFHAEESAVEPDAAGGARLVAKSPMLVVCRQLEALAQDASAALPALVNETFYDLTQRVVDDEGESRQKVVDGDFVAGRPYAASVTAMNPTDSKLSFSLLRQIPQGAIPTGGSQYTAESSMALRPHSDATVGYTFYFPRPGDFAHYPARASDAGGATASAAGHAFHVVAKPAEDNADTWEYVSQEGDDDAVIAFLDTHNVMRLDLSLVAFRMRDAAMFRRTTDLLRSRGRFDPAVWGYAFLHFDAATMAEYLAEMGRDGRLPWPWIDSPLFKSDAVADGRIEHAEYWPLVNARAHVLGGKRRILDETFAATYEAFLRYLSCKPAPDDSDRLALAVYLLLQDRVDDAAAQLAVIDPGKIAEKMQYDYLRAYMAFCDSKPEEARKIASRYADVPVERWRALFGEILAQAAEILDGAVAGADDAQGPSQPSLALEEDGDGIAIHYSGIESCVVKYYPMDLEMLFTRSPFAGDSGERFAMVRPKMTEQIDLPKGKTVARLKVAADFRARNARIEVEGGGVTAGIVHTPHTLVVRVAEAAGQLTATDARGKPIPAAYVKTYARWKDGRVLFYKDGYTDLRGRFDYASLSTDDLPQIERFAILVITPENGAVVREAAPPNR